MTPRLNVIAASMKRPSAGNDPYFANVSLLMHMNGSNGGTVFTEQTGKTVTRGGSAATSTAQSRFGGSSLLVNAADFLSLDGSHADWAFGSGDFTVEAWGYNTSLPPAGQTRHLIGKRGGSSTTRGWVELYIDEAGALCAVVSFSSTTLDVQLSGGSFQLSAWNHCALTREGSTFRLFLRGVLVASMTVSGSVYNDTTVPVQIGRRSSTNPFPWVGYIDDMRITKGVCRYTASFNQPEGPFPDM